MQRFSLIIFFYVHIQVSNTQILSRNDAWILIVSILEENLHFQFSVYWWLPVLLSVVSDQACRVFL